MLLVALVFALAGPPRLAAFASFPLFFDFDGDHKLDKAELLSGGVHKRIHFTLSSSRGRFLSFDTRSDAQGLLLATDIDHDNDLDLIWASPTEPQAAVVWLGNGRGDFELAQDVRPYAPELLLLFGSGADSGVSGERTVGHPTCALGPSLSFDLASANKLEIGAPSRSSMEGVERRPGLALYLAHLRERGPPPPIW